MLVLDPGEEFIDWFLENYNDFLTHFLNEPSFLEDVPEARSAYLTSSSNKAYISTRVMRSQGSVGELSVKASHSFSIKCARACSWPL